MTHFGRVTPLLVYEDLEAEVASRLQVGTASSGLVVQVDDVDEHFKRVVAAGARVDSDPVDQPYGQREYGARDPEGHRWWFATPLTQPQIT